MTLKQIIQMLLNGDYVVIEDDLNHFYEVKLEKVPDGVQLAQNETTLIIHSQRLRDKEMGDGQS